VSALGNPYACWSHGQMAVALTKPAGWARRWRSVACPVGALAWRRRRRAQPADSSGLIGRQPAAHGRAADPEQTGPLAAGTGLLGLQQREGLPSLRCMPIARRAEEPFQRLWRFVS
jgi:hypothetical protein